MVGALRDAAPGVPIVFLAWMKAFNYGESPTHKMPQLRRLAATLGFDVADVPAALRGGISVDRCTSGGGCKRHALALKDLFAWTSQGADHHPSALGHDLLGNIAALCIARRLKGPHRVGSTPGGLGDEAEDRQRQQPALTPAPVPVPAPEEQCYISADTMPVADSRGFVLQDDGGPQP